MVNQCDNCTNIRKFLNFKNIKKSTKKIKKLVIFFCFCMIFLTTIILVSAGVNINIITLVPNLDFTRFEAYNITADITNTTQIISVQTNISGINGEGGFCWDYFINGTCDSKTLNFDMIYSPSDGLWKKQNIYPDSIYPEIFFAPSEITWYNVPSNIDIWRRNYHLFNFTNSFRMVENMSFWIEFNTIANNPQNSNPLFVYIVGNGSNSIGLDYFESDWRQKENTELVATLSRNEPFHHTHTENSSHRLVALSTNNDGTIGSKNINLSKEFWIVLYQDSTNVNRGWSLRYHEEAICDNQNAWYIAERRRVNTWDSPVIQNGCPDVHIHIARNNAFFRDGVNATVIVTDEDSNVYVSSQEFYFGEIPNQPPNPTSFNNPLIGGVYNTTFINITWNPATDPNVGDTLTYNLSLTNSDGSFNQTLNVTNNLFYNWNTTDISNGDYSLILEVCDDGSPILCTNSYLDGNFTIDKSIQLLDLKSISIFSNNSVNSSFAKTGDLITISINSSGLLRNKNLEIYSGGYSINNLISVVNTSSIYNISYIINSTDREGGINFEITAGNLKEIYSMTTDNSEVKVDNTAPLVSELIIPFSNSNISSVVGLIVVNSSILDKISGVNSVYFNISNSSGEQSLLSSTKTSYKFWNATLNTNNLMDGNYNLSVIAKDNTGNINDSKIIEIIVDNTAPRVSLSQISSTIDTINVNFSCEDETTGVDYCEISTTYGEISNSVISGLFCGSSYEIELISRDKVGNEIIKRMTMSTQYCASSSLRRKESEIAVSPEESSVLEGRVFSIKSKEGIIFEVKSKLHTLTVNEFNTTHTRVTIESEPIIANLEMGIFYEFDLDGDSINDIRVIYEGINNSEAIIFIQEILYEHQDDEDTFSSENGLIKEEKKYAFLDFKVLVTILFFVIVLSLYFIIRKLKNSNKGKKFSKNKRKK